MTPPSISQQHPLKYEGKTVYVPPAGSDPKEIIKALDDFEKTLSSFLLRRLSLWMTPQSFNLRGSSGPKRESGCGCPRMHR